MKFRVLLIGCSGYIGSYLTEFLRREQIEIIGCDILPPNDLSTFKKFHESRYQELSQSQLSEADIVYWFAGHSSVKMANQSPASAIENNVSGLINLLTKAASVNRPVIYASSASVLSGEDDSFSMTARETSANVYDATKLALDIIAPYSGARARGLRLSTMSGWSPRLRSDLVFNAMNLTARKDGFVKVQNPSSFRSLLFLRDLANYLIATSNALILHTDVQMFQTVGLSSWSGTIGQLGAEIAHFWKVPLRIEGDTGTYSFVVNDRFSRGATLDSSAFYQPIAMRCQDFANHWSQ